jgi:hypothetical protein
MPEIVTQREVEVFNAVSKMRETLLEDLLFLGDLLSEARRDDHATKLGYTAFGDWLEATGIDMSERQAYYLVRIVDNAKELGIPREQLMQSKISKLKEIFMLDPSSQGDKIKQLVADSSSQALDEVREKVRQTRVEAGEEPLTWRNFKVTQSQAEIIDEAIERAKREYGHTIDAQTQELVDISPGKAIEMICADYLGNPDPVLERIEAIPDEA